MKSQQPDTPKEADEGIVLTRLDDLCLVHMRDYRVDAAQTRELGRRLIAFIERERCRKLVISFEGVQSLYSFLLDAPQLSREEATAQSDRPPAGSDLWFG